MRHLFFCLVSLWSFGLSAQPSSQPSSTKSEAAFITGEELRWLKAEKKKARRASLKWFAGGNALFFGSLGGLLLAEGASSEGFDLLMVGAGSAGVLCAVLGSSAGYFYAGEDKRGRRILSTQIISSATFATAVVAGFGAANASNISSDASDAIIVTSLFAGLAAVTISSGLMLFSFYDVGRAPQRIFDKNKEMFNMAPLILSGGGGLSLTFAL
jgi:hypothetical protein